MWLKITVAFLLLILQFMNFISAISATAIGVFGVSRQQSRSLRIHATYSRPIYEVVCAQSPKICHLSRTVASNCKRFVVGTQDGRKMPELKEATTYPVTNDTSIRWGEGEWLNHDRRRINLRTPRLSHWYYKKCLEERNFGPKAILEQLACE